MPGASGWPLSLSASCRRLRQRAAEHALDRLARQAAGAQQHRRRRSSRRWWIRRRPRPGRRRRSGRCGLRDRLAHAPPWSARRGRRDWPTAPPPARRRRAGCRAPPGGRERGPRRCRARRWRARRPAQSSAFGSTSVSGPGQNASASRRAPASKRRDLPRGREVADMGDQRIEGGPALGLVEPGDRGRHWRRQRRGRRPSRSGTRPARPRPGRARRRPRAASPAGKIRVFRPTFTGINFLNSASCGGRNPRL